MKIIAKTALATLVALGASQASAQKLTFTLNWVAGGDHAPYFYAQKMGLYKQAGLDVDFETGRGSAASAQKVGAGQSQLGLSDMAGVLLFRGKGVDAVGVMNVYANSPQGLYWLKSSGIRSVNDLAGKKIGNPAGDGARTMWPALAKKVGVDPNSVTWVNIDANAKLGALKARTIDATTSFFNLHHVFARELGSDMGFLAWKDAGVNPYGNSIIANGAWLKANRDKADKFVKITQKAFADCAKTPEPCIQALVEANGAWLKANRDKADKFVKITQKAFADCAKTPEPCIQALVEANGALLYQNELDNWHLVTILMSDETSRTVALGWHDDKRMADDYKLVDEYLKMEKPYDIKSAYTNDFLDKNVKMPPINPPKLY
jgi:NitT/TauT family transport system substrate-binding protein